MSLPELPQKDEDLLPPLGAAISVIREEQGMSVEAVAGRIGMNPEQLADLESGQSAPTWGDLRRLVASMEVPLTDLMDQVEASELEAWG